MANTLRRGAYALAFSLALSAMPAIAQLPPVTPIISPEVHSDSTATFRFRAAGATEVKFSLEGSDPVPMTKGDEGVWTYTSPALTPDTYGYHFEVDGVPEFDPNNTAHIKLNLLFVDNYLTIPSPTPQVWATTDVPHGEIHHHFYKSAVIGDQRDYFVYTPPNYDPKAGKKYPVLYLLHGYSDMASGWSAIGFANNILDNLIAQGKAKPMIVVMPLGYGVPDFASRTSQNFHDPALVKRNFDNFRQALLTEVLPQVEKEYRVSDKRDDRAIAGLSMGGAESLYTGLNNIDKFAYVGSFSGGGLSDDYSADFPTIDAAAAAKLRVLWIACGTDDHLITANRALIAWLKGKNINPTAIETPGRHTWMVWRRNLSNYAPLLFQGK
jgi:enterochelin esterase-like enzyme